MLKNIATRAFFRCLFSTQAIEAPKKYSEIISKARAVMPLYSLTPNSVGNIFIAPNATVVGEVYMGRDIMIGHGTVIRGDINSVLLHQRVLVGDNCVLHTAASLPSGLPAHLIIAVNSVVQSGCTLYSCEIGSGCFVGANSVILEGAKLQDGAVILPNSVVPPGRVVPANQVWGGNPIKFVRYAKEQEKFVTQTFVEESMKDTNIYKYQFLGYNNAYLFKSSNEESDAVKSPHYIKDTQTKVTGHYNPSNPTI